MQVTLYRFNGKETEANKLQGNITQLFDADVTPYGAFSATNVVFVLDTMYNANYCKYIYNNKTYYGFCTVNVTSNGLYEYQVTIDALGTAWYAGCFDTRLRATRCPKTLNQDTYPSHPVYTDPLFPLCSTPTYSKIELANYGNPVILLQIIQSSRLYYNDPNEATMTNPLWSTFINKETEIPFHGDKYATGHVQFGFTDDIGTIYTGNPFRYSTELITYVLSPSQFAKMYNTLKKAPSSFQAAFGKVVAKVAVIDDKFLPIKSTETIKSKWVGVATATTSSAYGYFAGIPFQGDDTNEYYFLPITDSLLSTVDGALAESPVYFKHVMPSTPQRNIVNAVSISLTSSYASPYVRTQFIYKLPYVGSQLSIPWSSLPPDAVETGSKLELMSQFDPGSFIVRYTPVITDNVNNHKYLYDLSVEGSLSSQFPLMLETSITNWTGVVMNTITTAVAAIATIASEGAAAPWLIGQAGSTAAAIASTAQQDADSSVTIVGVTGGCEQTGFGDKPLICLKQWRSWPGDYQSDWGVICDLIINSQSAFGVSGFYQLLKPNLLSKGYENPIITKAEEIATQGFYKN